MTNPIFELDNAKVFHGSNLDVLPTLPDNSVDAIVTDPPYELGFMGKSWDSSGIAYSVELWRECLRVLKPGGHLLSFGGTRTWHRVAVAIEDAGFEIRDSIAWLYGSGFPKSMDVSKAIDKAAGAEREVVGSKMASPKGISNAESRSDSAAGAYGGEAKEIDITAPATDEAKTWQGWGTALKPAHEPVVVARKPIVGTVAANVLAWGVGGLNIDGSRIKANGDNLNGGKQGGTSNKIYSKSLGISSGNSMALNGRWPANIILDETTAELLDEQSGTLKSGDLKPYVQANPGTGVNVMNSVVKTTTRPGDSGGASRFFYVAKASKRDRNEGLDELPDTVLTGRDPGQDAMQNAYKTRSKVTKNIHPTVKPTNLMRYLIKLVTPAGGVVLDPFTGSGSTGKAALLDGYKFIGIELTEEYLPIIKDRLTHAQETYTNNLLTAETEKETTLFTVEE